MDVKAEDAQFVAEELLNSDVWKRLRKSFTMADFVCGFQLALFQEYNGYNGED